MTPASRRKIDKLSKPGSPQTGEPVYLTIGKLRRTHGVQGEIIFDVLTDMPETIMPGLVVSIGSMYKETIIKSVRQAGNYLLVAFEGYNDCDQVAILRNQFVFINSKDAAPLKSGKYYHHEVIGIDVLDESGNAIGKITEIISTGANDVYVIQSSSGEEILIPAIKTVVLEIDPQKKIMRVHLPEWE